MHIIDIFILIILALAAVKGYIKGFIVELFAFIAFFFGLFVALSFTGPLARRFFAESHYYEVLAIAVFLLLFFGLSIIIGLIGKAIKKFVDLTFLGIFDNVLGIVIGVLKWILIISVIIWTVESVGFRLPASYTEESSIYPWIIRVAPWSFELIGKILPVFRDFLDTLDQFQDKGKFT